MQWRLLASSLLMVGVLGACALMPKSPERDTGAAARAWQDHRESVAAIQRWSLDGRVAMQTPQEGWQAGLYWQQAGDGYSLRIVAPFGQGTFGLDGDHTGVVMRTPDNKSLTAPDAEGLLQNNLGWSLPVSGLRYWVRGIPDPSQSVTALQLDDAGRMTDLQQSGWRISVLSYAHSGAVDLPVKLFMHTDKFKLRLVIHRWTQG